MENKNNLTDELKRSRKTKIPESLRSHFLTEVIPSLQYEERRSFAFFLSLRYIALIVVALLLLGSTMAVAARESEPGELLYPVKSFIERVASGPIKPLIQKPVEPSPTQTPAPEELEHEDESEDNDDSEDDERKVTASPSSVIQPTDTPEIPDEPENEIHKKSVNESKQIEEVLLETVDIEDEDDNKENNRIPTSAPSHNLPLHVSIDISPVQIKL